MKRIIDVRTAKAPTSAPPMIAPVWSRLIGLPEGAGVVVKGEGEGDDLS